MHTHFSTHQEGGGGREKVFFFLGGGGVGWGVENSAEHAVLNSTSVHYRVHLTLFLAPPVKLTG